MGTLPRKLPGLSCAAAPREIWEISLFPTAPAVLGCPEFPLTATASSAHYSGSIPEVPQEKRHTDTEHPWGCRARKGVFSL